MKKLPIILLFIPILFPIFHSNDLLNDFNWEIGDYWKYERITRYDDGRIADREIVEYEVVKKENVTFYGKNYYGYKVEGRVHSINYTINFTEFYRVYDLAYIGRNPWYGGRGWLIYDPPMERFKFLEVGKKWNQTITMIYNGSSITQNTTFIVYYECIKEENVKTRAGNFKCYVVKEQKERENLQIVVSYIISLPPLKML